MQSHSYRQFLFWNDSLQQCALLGRQAPEQQFAQHKAPILSLMVDEKADTHYHHPAPHFAPKHSPWEVNLELDDESAKGSGVGDIRQASKDKLQSGA